MDQISLTTEAIERVEHHADERWKAEATLAIKEVATVKREFTTDDVWQQLKMHVDAATHEPRAMGAMMVSAKKAGICTPLMKFEGSSRISCHNRPIRVWRSCLYEVV